jgi:cytochrome c peroxidase
VAPPLDGIWASAPYFHNGSVPTLWHVLHPEARPQVWKRTVDGYDVNRVGLEIESLPELPAKLSTVERRRHFDTTKFGKSAAGHEYPNDLNEAEKQAVLEYLKTL